MSKLEGSTTQKLEQAEQGGVQEHVSHPAEENEDLSPQGISIGHLAELTRNLRRALEAGDKEKIDKFSRNIASTEEAILKYKEIAAYDAPGEVVMEKLKIALDAFVMATLIRWQG